MRVRLPFVAFALALSVAGAAEASPYSSLYVFGDSLSDTGNVFLATNGTVPGSPYVAGRFSNGPNWADDLSAALGLGLVKPSLSGGNDYAFGGAVTGTSVPGPAPTVPTIAQQVAAFTFASGGQASATALYAMWIGSNDVFAALSDLAAGTLTMPQAATDLSQAAQAEADSVLTLALEGAHTFLVPLVPDLGKTPNGTAIPGLATVASSLSASYNAALAMDLLAVVNSVGADVRFVNTFSLIDQAVADPAAFGLTDATDPCYVGTLTGGGSVCATPDSYLFWDGEHPTATAHALIAAAALQALPEPSTAALLPIAMLGLLATRWRPARRPAR